MTQREVVLEGGVPWGFRMQGGADVKTPLRVSRVNPGSKAAQRGIREGDLITTINGESTKTLTGNEAHDLLKGSGNTLKLVLNEGVEPYSKRRHYRTVHQETHQETVKRSSVTYQLQETIERNRFNDLKPNDVSVVTNIPVSQKSTSSSSTSSGTLLADGKTLSSDQAVASRQSSYSNCSSIPDEGLLSEWEEMNDDSGPLSKSKKRRQRRKNLLARHQRPVEITLQPSTSPNLEVVRLNRIEHKYKVESPKELKLSSKKRLKARSKSLDGDDFLRIQELSEASESEEGKSQINVIVSEASSDENLLDDSDTEVVRNLEQSAITPEEEQVLRSFLGGLQLVNSPEESAKELYLQTDPKAKKLQKLKQLEEYFTPIAENPRYLDAISEEASSDLSDREQAGEVCNVVSPTADHAEVVYLEDSSDEGVAVRQLTPPPSPESGGSKPAKCSGKPCFDYTKSPNVLTAKEPDNLAQDSLKTVENRSKAKTGFLPPSATTPSTKLETSVEATKLLDQIDEELISAETNSTSEAKKIALETDITTASQGSSIDEEAKLLTEGNANNLNADKAELTLEGEKKNENDSSNEKVDSKDHKVDEKSDETPIKITAELEGSTLSLPKDITVVLEKASGNPDYENLKFDVFKNGFKESGSDKLDSTACKEDQKPGETRVKKETSSQTSELKTESSTTTLRKEFSMKSSVVSGLDAESAKSVMATKGSKLTLNSTDLNPITNNLTIDVAKVDSKDHKVDEKPGETPIKITAEAAGSTLSLPKDITVVLEKASGNPDYENLKFEPFKESGSDKLDSTACKVDQKPGETRVKNETSSQTSELKTESSTTTVRKEFSMKSSVVSGLDAESAKSVMATKGSKLTLNSTDLNPITNNLTIDVAKVDSKDHKVDEKPGETPIKITAEAAGSTLSLPKDITVVLEKASGNPDYENLKFEPFKESGSDKLDSTACKVDQKPGETRVKNETSSQTSELKTESSTTTVRKEFSMKSSVVSGLEVESAKSNNAPELEKRTVQTGSISNNEDASYRKFSSVQSDSKPKSNGIDVNDQSLETISSESSSTTSNRVNNFAEEEKAFEALYESSNTDFASSTLTTEPVFRKETRTTSGVHMSKTTINGHVDKEEFRKFNLKENNVNGNTEVIKDFEEYVTPKAPKLDDSKLRHVIMTSHVSNKTDSQKLLDFENIRKLNSEIQEKIEKRQLIGPVFRRSKTPTVRKEDELPGKTLIQQRVKEFTSAQESEVKEEESVEKSLVQSRVKEFTEPQEGSVLRRFLSLSDLKDDCSTKDKDPPIPPPPELPPRAKFLERKQPPVPPRPTFDEGQKEPPVPPPRRSKAQLLKKPQSPSTTYSNVVTPPRAPSADSSESDESSSRCTAKYNPNSSLADVSSLADESTLLQPKSLRDLVLQALVNCPFGESVLGELAEVSKRLANRVIGFKGSKEMELYEDERSKIAELQRRFNAAEEVTRPSSRLLTIIREEQAESEPVSEERLKAKNLGEWLTLARHKSMSTSNLDCTSVPKNSLRRATTSDKCANGPRRLSLPQEIYEKQLIDIMEKEREIQKELEQLEEEKRKLRAEMAPSKHFQVDDFYVSKKGDFAERRERPLSMPAFPTEFFRQQMYQEYVDKFTEREERKQQKVIKISSVSDQEPAKPKEIFHPIELEQEFMERVKQKLGKLHQDWEEKEETATPDSVDVPPVIVLDRDRVTGVEALPPHLREFVDDLATQPEDSSVWSPGQLRRPPTPPNKHYQRTDSQTSQHDPISPVWTPKSANSSPVAERKEFRPVNFQSPVLGRRHRTKSETVTPPDSEPPWKLPEGSSDPALNISYTLDRRLPTSQSSPGFGSVSRLPRAQNPTITLLQKAREGQLPKGAQYLDQERKPPNDRPPIKYPGEVLYQHKNEHTSDAESEKPKKMADPSPRKFEGIGPTTKDGMPLILRSEVKNEDQSRWYKRMYDTIHKQKPHKDEYVTIKYKQKRAQYPYTSGYLSEPEPGAYDSDFSEYKYQTLDRRRTPQQYLYFSDSNAATMPRSVPDKSYSSSDIVKNTQEKYYNQPGRIENYRPGHSSISEKEARRWWDEVMEIFDGHLEQQKRMPPPKPRSFINQALKESGYESDSTLVFKRKEETAASQSSSKDQREVYRSIQKGGDVPFQGLRKPAPERPRETDVVEFFPMTTGLTKIRIHKSLVPPQEYFCYPATVQSSKTFANFKRIAPASVKADPPPCPPKRKSSRNNNTLRLISTMKVKRHETCFSSAPADKTKVNYLKDKITCKLSPGSKKRLGAVKKATASPDLKSKVTSSRKVTSTTKVTADKKPRTLYKSGSSGSLSSSRTSTPVKTFGSEKKKFELSLPLKSKHGASGGLLSPTEVKKAIRNISKTPQIKPLTRKTPVEPKKLAKPKGKKLANGHVKSQCLSKATGAEVAKHLDSQPCSFFTRLFFKDAPIPEKKSLLQERTTQLAKKKIAPSVKKPVSVGAMKIYLKHTRPVSDSKFISLDVRSRSASPKSVTFSDNLTTKRSRSLPVSTRKPTIKSPTRSPSPVKKFLARPLSPISRSSSPVKKLYFSETSRPVSPEVRQKVRSPSSRRIMQLKQQQQPLYTNPELNHSCTSLDSFRSEDYQVYLKDFFGSETSEKFKDLNHFYSDIEKVGQLERNFCLKPRKKGEEEIIDYDRWMEVRTREKTEHELKHLYDHLKSHEKEKGFLFLPKDVGKFRWRRELDRGLRIKEKSVDNIKEAFERLRSEESELESSRRRDLDLQKDVYKPLWRGTSVANLAHSLWERRSQSEGRARAHDKFLTSKIGSTIWSSLSLQQVNNLRKQLQEIYGDDTHPLQEEPNVVEVPSKVPRTLQLTVRRNSESSKHDLLSEEEKKELSQSISKEVLEKIAKRRKDNKLALPLVVGREVLGAVACQHQPPEPQKALLKTDAVNSPPKTHSVSETESASTDDSTKTVINLQDVQKKVEYFEKAKEADAYVPTVYTAAEESPPASPQKPLPHSQSSQNLKEYFGESELVKFATLPLAATKKSEYNYTRKPHLRQLDISPIRTISSMDSPTISRSASPYFEEAQAVAKKGEVRKLKKQFEFFEDFFGEKLKRSRSENDLKSLGHVDDLRKRYEYPAHSGRGRSRVRRGVSPVVWLRPEDRYMPHINIISKIASLYSSRTKGETSKSVEELADILGCPVGEVEKMKEKFDRLREKEEEISLVGRMYTSSPNLKELRDITPYLTANWIAHKYPRSEDNTRSISTPETSMASRDTSLVRRDSRPSKGRFESSRYTKEPDLPPPPPPPKSQGGVRSQEQESPRKYVENEVTIHYKTPIRTEIKDYVSEDELAHRQAEAMKKIYEEERRRKYLQVSSDESSARELQDMKSRRHTDNFTPSQKSPIPLNRYDDFDDLSAPPKPRTRSPEPRLVARALYNFVGQSAKELTFRKGELIYVRRQIDKNWYEGELNAMVGLFPVNYVEIVPYEGNKVTIPRKAHEGQARAKYNFIAQTHLELSLAKGELVTVTRRVDDNWYEGKIGGRKGIFPVSYVEILIDPSDPPPPSSKPVASPAAHSLLLNGSSQGKESMGSHLYTPNIPNPIMQRDKDNGFHHAKPVQLSGSGTYSTLPKPNKSPIDQTLHIETQSEPVPYRALYKYAPQNDDELELLEGDTVYVLEKCDDGWYVGSSERTGAFGTFPGNYVERI